MSHFWLKDLFFAVHLCACCTSLTTSAILTFALHMMSDLWDYLRALFTSDWFVSLRRSLLHVIYLCPSGHLTLVRGFKVRCSSCVSHFECISISVSLLWVAHCYLARSVMLPSYEHGTRFNELLLLYTTLVRLSAKCVFYRVVTRIYASIVIAAVHCVSAAFTRVVYGRSGAPSPCMFMFVGLSRPSWFVELARATRLPSGRYTLERPVFRLMARIT